MSREELYRVYFQAAKNSLKTVCITIVSENSTKFRGILLEENMTMKLLINKLFVFMSIDEMLIDILYCSNAAFKWLNMLVTVSSSSISFKHNPRVEYFKILLTSAYLC